jgi:hypothetical protein
MKFWIGTVLLCIFLANVQQDRSINRDHCEEGKSMKFSARRLAPKDVPPVIFDGVRYEVLLEGRFPGTMQHGGRLAAIDEVSGEQLWELLVYQVDFDGKFESDVQDVFIVDMALAEDQTKLLIRNGKKKNFALDLKTRIVQMLD